MADMLKGVDMNFEPIGIVKSPVKQAVDKDWGKVISEIRIDSKYAGSLFGINAFSHIVVVFGMHESTWAIESDLVRRPQGRSDMPLVGIFAQRARHRPNPIGVTSVRLLSAEGSSLFVRGLDAIDETPVLDIKPYFPQYDRVADAQYPEWVDKLMADYF
jgi:tRNA-Thr(GGU) m(6)t(6)A37 methyltransferase TsaA